MSSPDKFKMEPGDLVFRLPVCSFCVHEQIGDRRRFCAAYPDRVALRLEINGATHDTVEPDLVGTTVFRRRPKLFDE